MKKTLLFAISLISLVACGPSEAEKAKEQQIQDSIKAATEAAANAEAAAMAEETAADTSAAPAVDSTQAH